jgi:O-antigen/teichoic acid export membrane protein
MSRVRRAFLMSSFEQYTALLVNFAMIVVLARLLTPAQIGLAVVGMGLSTTIFSLREFATADFLIQRHKVEVNDTRTAFTLGMALALVLATALHLVSDRIGDFYGEPSLQDFLALTLIGAVLDTTAMPTIALLRREMAFGVLARIRTSASLITAATTVSLAWLGHASMSYAWGLLAGGCTTAMLAYAARPVWEDFRPSLASWRELVAFGRYRGATSVLEKAYDAMPQLVLGHFMTMTSVGYYNRANAICGIPDRMLLSSVFAVAFPALAEHLRQGRDMKASYLRVLSYISVVYWPALICLAITADTVVHIILGSNWTEIVPLVRLLSLSALFWFPVVPTTPLLLALGKNRDAFLANFFARGLSALILCSASLYGIFAMAASQFLVLPFQMMVALHYAKRHVNFTWGELIEGLWPSAVVTVFTAAGPLAVALAEGGTGMSVGTFFLAGILASFGWACGLAVTHHPFLEELREPLRTVGLRLARLISRRPSVTTVD